jgi:hypothetical protein
MIHAAGRTDSVQQDDSDRFQEQALSAGRTPDSVSEEREGTRLEWRRVPGSNGRNHSAACTIASLGDRPIRSATPRP